MSTSGGSHAYAFAANEEAAKTLAKEDAILSRLNNVILLAGLQGCRNTYVGDAMIRGVSGGQKRRVTLTEMLIAPRPAKFLDSITNGLDSATAFDICQFTRSVCHILDITIVMSLLQPPPEVFDLFDEVILLSEGQSIYHGPRDEILPYFESIGYHCPDNVDVADFLQELPKLEGRRFIKDSSTISAADAPRGTTALVAAWKQSRLYRHMLDEMDGKVSASADDVERGQINDIAKQEWPEDLKEPFANDFFKVRCSIVNLLLSACVSFFDCCEL